MEETPTVCSSCEFEGAPLEEYPGSYILETETQWLCEICGSTFLSNILQYNHYSSAEKHLAQGIAWIGNRILQELRKP